LLVPRRYLPFFVVATSIALSMGATAYAGTLQIDEQESQQALSKAQVEQRALKKEIAELAAQRDKLNKKLKESDISIANLRKRIETIESSLKKKQPKS